MASFAGLQEAAWGLQMGDGVKKTPLETMGGNLVRGPVFRPRIVQEAAQQGGRKFNGKHPLKRQFALQLVRSEVEL
jgi:hypothetical protein